jgi:hypothetical protein
VRFLFRTGLATGMVVGVLVLASALWAEYSARGSCASVGSPAASAQREDGSSDTLVDEALPGYQIGEKHSIWVDAPPARVFDSLERDAGGEHPILSLFGLLTVFGERGASSLSEADEPVLDWLRTGRVEALEGPGREVVLVADDTGVVSFSADPEAGGARVVTETRVAFHDRASCRQFGRYWGVIYPGSSLHRVYLLETIRHRVEVAASPDNRSDESSREKRRPERSVAGATVTEEREA